jgi:hypothetical protein
MASYITTVTFRIERNCWEVSATFLNPTVFKLIDGKGVSPRADRISYWLALLSLSRDCRCGMRKRRIREVGFLLKNPANSKLILSAGNEDVLQFEDFATFAF